MTKMKHYSIAVILLLVPAHILAIPKKHLSYSEKKNCVLKEGLAEEIASYDSAVRDIFDYVLKGPFKHRTYNELAKFVDKFGARPSGTEVLENSIDYIINITKEEGMHDVKTENVKVPYFERGEENLIMTTPRVKKMALIGLGKTVSTPEEGIEAEVVTVTSFEELERVGEEIVKGKIVLYNVKFTTYGETVKYRVNGASAAAKMGAVASLVRSIAPFSINSPHTGAQIYESGVNKIPSAAITIEDAELISRLTAIGEKVRLKLKLISSIEENKLSRNTIVDLQGSEHPEKLVIVSGHIDSWDVGQGAMDDGGGLFVSWAAPIVLKNLNLKPKRTVRAIFWTGEELGLIGAKAYQDLHRNESGNINLIMESDEGTFKPRGLAVGGTQEARCIIAEVLKLFKSINASELVEDEYPGSDITIIMQNGVPGASLLNKNEKYFWFHHSEGDTMTVEDPDELDLGTAFWTAVSYIIADISADIPR